MIASFKLVQPENAFANILVTPSMIVTVLILSFGIEIIDEIVLFSISLPIVN